MRTAAIALCIIAVGSLSGCVAAPEDVSGDEAGGEWAASSDDVDWIGIAPGGSRDEGSGNETPRPPDGDGQGRLGGISSPLLRVTPGDPAELYIESITTGGTGCPTEASVSTIIDGNTFQLFFNQMSLVNPSASGQIVQNINCAAGVQLHIPQGWQFSIATVNTRGYAYLEKDIKARETSEYWFAGVRLEQTFRSNLVGPYDNDYDFTDQVPFESTVWSPCGSSAIFSINTSLNLNAARNKVGEAIFNAEALDGTFRKLLHLSWRRCTI